MFWAIVIALDLWGSIIFAAPSSNSSLCFAVVLGILLLARHLNRIALQEAEPVSPIIYALSYVLPHLELFDGRDLIIHRGALIPWWAVGLATLYAAAYTTVFLIGARLLFRRKTQL